MKKFKILILSLVMISAITTPKKSEAAVALFTGNGALALYGLGATVASPGLLIAGVSDIESSISTPLIWAGLLSFVGGIILLDGAEEQELAFLELTAEQASKLNLNMREINNYNNEIDQANVLLEEVSHELGYLSKPTTEDAKAVWENVKDYVSSDTFKVMSLIGAQLKQ